jgi:hypothetical protein
VSVNGRYLRFAVAFCIGIVAAAMSGASFAGFAMLSDYFDVKRLGWWALLLAPLVLLGPYIIVATLIPGWAVGKSVLLVTLGVPFKEENGGEATAFLCGYMGGLFTLMLTLMVCYFRVMVYHEW